MTSSNLPCYGMPNSLQRRSRQELVAHHGNRLLNQSPDASLSKPDQIYKMGNIEGSEEVEG